MKTFKDLSIGTIVTYNDMANVDLQFVILNQEETKFGSYVNVMNLETRSIELKSLNTEIGTRWTL